MDSPVEDVDDMSVRYRCTQRQCAPALEGVVDAWTREGGGRECACFLGSSIGLLTYKLQHFVYGNGGTGGCGSVVGGVVVSPSLSSSVLTWIN